MRLLSPQSLALLSGAVAVAAAVGFKRRADGAARSLDRRISALEVQRVVDAEIRNLRRSSQEHRRDRSLDPGQMRSAHRGGRS